MKMLKKTLKSREKISYISTKKKNLKSSKE